MIQPESESNISSGRKVTCTSKCISQFLVLAFTQFQIVYEIFHLGLTGISLIVAAWEAVVDATEFQISLIWVIVLGYFLIHWLCLRQVVFIIRSIHFTQGNQNRTLTRLYLFLTIKLLLISLSLISVAWGAVQKDFCDLAVYYIVFESLNVILYFCTIRIYLFKNKHTVMYMPPREGDDDI